MRCIRKFCNEFTKPLCLNSILPQRTYKNLHISFHSFTTSIPKCFQDQKNVDTFVRNDKRFPNGWKENSRPHEFTTMSYKYIKIKIKQETKEKRRQKEEEKR